MRYLPCDNCRETALATKDGTLYAIGTLHDASHTYLCQRCGRTSIITADRFSRLPELTVEELKAETHDLPYFPTGHPDTIPTPPPAVPPPPAPPAPPPPKKRRR